MSLLFEIKMRMQRYKQLQRLFPTEIEAARLSCETSHTWPRGLAGLRIRLKGRVKVIKASQCCQLSNIFYWMEKQITPKKKLLSCKIISWFFFKKCTWLKSVIVNFFCLIFRRLLVHQTSTTAELLKLPQNKSFLWFVCINNKTFNRKLLTFLNFVALFIAYTYS